ncbi:MAG: LLM class F420-dependent oxidoreductase [Acidimicrobiales bacterium]
MHIGVVFPQTELGGSAANVRRYAEGVQALGFAHVLAYDHVVGADPEVHAPWRGPYDVHTTFHEPFVLFGFLAGFTTLELVTGIIIAPQRQTALIAKQAAEVDVLTEGRFRLGLGVGWNPVEYEALGEDFRTRGARLDEQIPLLRRLWTDESVTHDGRFDKLTAAGLSPLPVQRPIPVWLGGSSAPAYRRIGRLADGWFPQVRPGEPLDDALATIGEAAAQAGRDPAAIQMEGRVSWTADGVPKLVDQVGRWESAGASHLGVNTMGASLATVDDHLDVLAQVAEALGLDRARPS